MAELERPGGELASRPLHFFWMVDCSGSMFGDGKIGIVNNAIQECIPEMASAAENNPNAQLLIRALQFSTGASWITANPVPVEDYSWEDMSANGVTDMGKAFELLAAQLGIPPMPTRALPPVIVLLSDGQPTDDYKKGLDKLKALPWFKKAVRIAISIGKDADDDVLTEFTGNRELVLQANNPTALVKMIKWASTTASMVSAPSSKNDDVDEYIAQLLEDATVYTTFPKPRGKGGAPNINRMSDEFIHCFERLSKMGRLDVVSEIMTKFAAVRDVLKPVTFDSWMSFMSRGLKSGDMVKIYRYNKDIFEAWLEGDNLRDWDIIRVAEGFANGCTREEFQEFRNLIIRHKGKIDGLDACFEATSENTETQLLFDGNTLKLSLDFVEVIGSDPISNIELHFLSVSKCRDLSSVRLIKCVINGIETDDCGFLSEMDENPKVGYYIFDDNEEVEDSLTVYSDFFDDNDIDEVKSIVLRFVVMNDDAEAIEEMTDIVIELDDFSGEYKVKQKAESTRCTADFSLDDEEDDEANGEEEIELDSDDFSDTSIYEDDNDVCVEFCGLEFDEDDETITLRIWCRNYSEKKKKFWIDNVEVDGESYGLIDNLGTVDSDDSDYCNYVLSDIDYSLVDTIEFEIEIDDEENTELGRSRRVSIDVDTSDESFAVRIFGDATYSDYDNASNKDGSEDEELIEEDIDEFDDDFEDEEISIVDDEDSENIFGGKISSQVGTLRELISFKDFELPFRVMRFGDSSKIYQLQTMRDNAVYAEIFEDGESVDYCRFSINETQKFMIVEE